MSVVFFFRKKILLYNGLKAVICTKVGDSYNITHLFTKGTRRYKDGEL